jgi:hypothetical protein
VCRSTGKPSFGAAAHCQAFTPSARGGMTPALARAGFQVEMFHVFTATALPERVVSSGENFFPPLRLPPRQLHLHRRERFDVTLQFLGYRGADPPCGSSSPSAGRSTALRESPVLGAEREACRVHSRCPPDSARRPPWRSPRRAGRLARSSVRTSAVARRLRCSRSPRCTTDSPRLVATQRRPGRLPAASTYKAARRAMSSARTRGRRTLMGGHLVSQTAVSLCRQLSCTGALERITSV